jgi:hypothetical protein
MTCHWPGCSVLVSSKEWACPQHWALLPKLLRTKLTLTYRPDNPPQTIDYVRVSREVNEWIHVNAMDEVFDAFRTTLREDQR